MNTNNFVIKKEDLCFKTPLQDIRGTAMFNQLIKSSTVLLK